MRVSILSLFNRVRQSKEILIHNKEMPNQLVKEDSKPKGNQKNASQKELFKQELDNPKEQLNLALKELMFPDDKIEFLISKAEAGQHEKYSDLIESELKKVTKSVFFLSEDKRNSFFSLFTETTSSSTSSTTSTQTSPSLTSSSTSSTTSTQTSPSLISSTAPINCIDDISSLRSHTSFLPSLFEESLSGDSSPHSRFTGPPLQQLTSISNVVDVLLAYVLDAKSGKEFVKDRKKLSHPFCDEIDKTSKELAEVKSHCESPEYFEKAAKFAQALNQYFTRSSISSSSIFFPKIGKISWYYSQEPLIKFFDIIAPIFVLVYTDKIDYVLFENVENYLKQNFFNFDNLINDSFYLETYAGILIDLLEKLSKEFSHGDHDFEDAQAKKDKVFQKKRVSMLFELFFKSFAYVTKLPNEQVRSFKSRVSDEIYDFKKIFKDVIIRVSNIEFYKYFSSDPNLNDLNKRFKINPYN